MAECNQAYLFLKGIDVIGMFLMFFVENMNAINHRRKET